jgi:hypothetical protein
MMNHLMAQNKIVLHPLPPQVEIAIFQAQRLINRRVVVNVKGRRFGRVDNLDRVGQNFDFTGRQFGILKVGRPLLNDAGQFDHEFRA